MTDDIQMDPQGFDALKGDVKKLISDASDMMGSATADAKAKWAETQPVLEEKLAKAQEQAQQLGSASMGAAGEMHKGVMGAFGELKKAFDEAKKHFVAPETDMPSDEPTH